MCPNIWLHMCLFVQKLFNFSEGAHAITDVIKGSIRIPIETDLEFQRAFSGSFQWLPMRSPLSGRGALAIGVKTQQSVPIIPS